MALHNNVEMPTYIVYRNIQPGQPANLAAPLAFFPPLGSDELFDALRAKYPHLKTHSERVGQASLDFFYEEDLTEQATFSTQFSTPQTSQSTTVSPWEPSLPSFCSEASTWSSPEGFGPATPSSSPQTLPLSRQQSTTTSFTASGETSPPGLQSMTSVFSLANTVQPKQRIRRKMTESEKAEYRKRRIVKACDKCAKRKRKCTHNSDELHQVGVPYKMQTNKKPTTTDSKRPQQPREQHQDQPPLENIMDFDSSSDPISLFDDFEGILPDVTTDFNLDDFLAPAHSQWAWSDTPDWTLLDPVIQDNATTRTSGFEQQSRASQQMALFDELDLLPDMNASDHIEMNHNPRADIHSNATREPHQRYATALQVAADASSERIAELLMERGASIEDVSYVDPSLLAQGVMQRNRPGSCERERHRKDNEGHIPQREVNANSSSGGLRVQKRKAAGKTAADSRTNASAPSLTDPYLEQGVGTVWGRDGLEGRHLLEGERQDQRSDRNGTPSRGNVGLSLNKAPSSSKRMLPQGATKSKKQALGLGEGLTSSTIDPGTQLFMLKRRLTRVTQAGNSSTSGSMLRLQTIPRLQTNPTAPLSSAGVDGFGAPQLQVLHGMISAQSPNINAVAPNTNALVPAYPHPANLGGATASDMPSHPDLSMYAVCEERLSDHFRRRDHFGRHHFGRAAVVVSQACKLLAVVGCFLVLQAYLAVPPQSLSMVLLALMAPVHDPSESSTEENSTKRSGASRWFNMSRRSLRSHAGTLLSGIASPRKCGGLPLANFATSIVQ